MSYLPWHNYTTSSNLTGSEPMNSMSIYIMCTTTSLARHIDVASASNAKILIIIS